MLVRVLDTTRLSFPRDAVGAEPFAGYRSLLHSYHRATAGGVTDAGFLALVERLDRAVAAVDGHGFVATPFMRSEHLSERLGFQDGAGVWVKDETHNVAGSHKGRHLMGVLLHLEVAERTGLASPEDRPDLAIASCGNAALAAAVVAAAGGWRLRVFVPVDANAGIVARLNDLGADVVVCPRRPGEAGDPTYARLREEIEAGALPFTCQGNENGLAIEGGETLGLRDRVRPHQLAGSTSTISSSRSAVGRSPAVACRPSPRRCSWEPLPAVLGPTRCRPQVRTP